MILCKFIFNKGYLIERIIKVMFDSRKIWGKMERKENIKEKWKKKKVQKNKK